MRRKMSIVIIAFMLITQLMQGFVFTPSLHAQDVSADEALASEASVIESPPSDDTETPADTDSGEVTVPDTIDPEVTAPAEESSEDITEDPDTDSAGAEEPGDMTNLTNASAGSEITENLIKDVQMYNEEPAYDGNGKLEIQGDKLEDIRPNLNDKVAVVFTWGLPNDSHSYTDGSTYTFHMPDKFQIGSELRGPLDGGVGDYVVYPNGEVTFIFNEEITGAQLEGIFYVWVQFDGSKLGSGLEQPIDFSSVGQDVIHVHFANTAANKLTKTGVANKNSFNSDEIIWTVDFNQGEKEIKNAVLEDTLPDDLPLKGNIELRQLEVQLDGTITAGNIVRNESEFPIHLGDIHNGYRVTYTTSIKAPTTAPFTNRVYENQADLTGDNGYYETASGKVTVSFNEPLNKSGQDSAYDPVTQTITWKVQFNYNQQALSQTNAWIEDQFDASQKLVDNSVKVYQMDIDDSGKATRSGQVDLNNYTVTKNTAGFRLQFNEAISSAYEIEYQTQAKERVYENTTVNNTITMYDGTTKKTQKNIQEIIFAKSVKNEDFNKKEIEWNLILNRDLKEMTDVLITDNYEGRHMQLIQNSLQINGAKSDQFELVANPDDPEYRKGFIIRLKNDASISTLHEITYKTSFDPTAGMPTNNEYRNTAELNWKESDVSQTRITKSAVVNPQNYTIDNGNKNGEYSAKDKSITWTIDANYNLYDIQDAIIRDEYTGNQSFVPGSLKVNKLELQGENNVTDIGDEVSLTPEQFQLNSDGKGFQINLGSIGKTAYRVVYKTSLDGEFDVDGTYSNHATLSDGENGPIRFEKSSQVTPAHGGIYVSKTGKQEGTSDIASWTVNINPSQSYIASGSKLTDTLSDNQILLSDSLKLYKTDLPANNSGNVSIKSGLVDPDDYELIVEGNTFTFTFKHPLKTAFILEYKSYINAGSGDRISNQVAFAGQTSSVKGSDQLEGFQVYLAGAGGGASTGSDKMKIKKVDDTGLPLKGVVFQIYNASGTTLLETLEPTDEDGETVTARNYRYNDQTNGLPYKLKEVSAPAGYLPDAEYGALTGKAIEFKDPNQSFEIINEKIRQGFELSKVDAMDTRIKLSGAVFELYFINPQGESSLIDTLTTDENGRIPKGELTPGNYELIEKTAPPYYTVDATPIPFTIAANQTQIVSLTHRNTQGTDGVLIVTKVNAKDQAVLSGVEFELRDRTGSVIATKVTDLNGVAQFDNLPYGLYTLVETKADGFVIEVPETPVSIIKSETHLTIENKENDRSVKLIKYNSTKSKLLQGAVFELRAQTALMDPNGDWMFQTATDIDEALLTTNQNGELYLEDLEPNIYQLVEVKAPAGYVLDSTPVEFEITDRQTETVVVEKTNQAISLPGGPSEPSNPGQPSPETPNSNTDSSPGLETPAPDDETTGVNPEIPTVPDSGDSSPEPSDPSVPSNEEEPSVGNEGDELTTDTSGGSDTSDTDTNEIAGAQNGINKISQGMLPKTGEESRLGFMVTGTLLIMLGCWGFFYSRRKALNLKQ
ncbi:SpaA isopeptide-forming pilin-related protein [Neobacillus mesonae]|nr:SpaA isopeptide-forming pilin-related protein [Neobacillus mesonae]